MIRRRKKIYVGKIKIHCVSLWNKARQHRLSVNGKSVVPIVRKKGPDYQVLLPSTSNVYSHTVSRINAYRYIFLHHFVGPSACAAEICGSACGCSEDLG